MEGLAAPQECLDIPKEVYKCVEGRNLTTFSSKGGNLSSLLHVELLDHRIWSADNSLVLALVCNSFKRPLTLDLDIHLTYQHSLTSQNTGKSQLLKEQKGTQGRHEENKETKHTEVSPTSDQAWFRPDKPGETQNS